MSNYSQYDIDPIETIEWIDSIESVILTHGVDRAKFIIQKLIKKIKKCDSYNLVNNFVTDYINTISTDQEEKYPGDLNIEKKLDQLLDGML